jgi:nucleotide-binding universal stress UspA family protein
VELEAWLEPAHRVGIKTDAIVDDGNAAARILEHASSSQADLIVMGTHGLSGFERFMLGSVAEKVLRKATCPAMTVPPAAVTTARVPYSRLLCPVDFSESSLAALRFVCSLAEEADANLIVIGVRGRNALDLTVFGSTTNQVVRRAPCPVLTMKH